MDPGFRRDDSGARRPPSFPRPPSSSPADRFWLLHAGLVGAAGLGLLVARSYAGRILDPTEEEVEGGDAEVVGAAA